MKKNAFFYFSICLTGIVAVALIGSIPLILNNHSSLSNKNNQLGGGNNSPTNKPLEPTTPIKPDESKNTQFDFTNWKQVQYRESSFLENTSLKGKTRDEIINGKLIDKQFIFENINLFLKGDHNVDSVDKIYSSKVLFDSLSGREGVAFGFSLNPNSIYIDGKLNSDIYPSLYIPSNGKTYIYSIEYLVFWPN